MGVMNESGYLKMQRRIREGPAGRIFVRCSICKKRKMRKNLEDPICIPCNICECGGKMTMKARNMSTDKVEWIKI